MEQEARALLEEPDSGRQARVDVANEVRAEATDWKGQVSRLEAEVKDWQERASALRIEVDEWKERASDLEVEAEDREALVSHLRARENEVRRRAKHQAELQVRQERERLLTRLLTAADNLERALSHAAKTDPLRAGVQLSLDDLRNQLAQEGVEPIEALGRPFDPNVHEAVSSDGTNGDTVIKVVATGYTHKGDLLRPARVVVGSLA
jgi:molecular chaperone GrpE